MKRGMIIACLIGLMAACGVRAADEPASPPTGEHHSPRGGMDGLLPPRLLEKLALTADQKTKYDSLNASFKKDVAKLSSTHSSAGEGSSATSTNSASTDHASVNHKGTRELRKKYVDQLRPFLTNEQTTTLDKAIENMRDHRAGQGGTTPAAKPAAPPSDT